MCVFLLGWHPALRGELVDYTRKQVRELRQQVGTAHAGLLRELPNRLWTKGCSEIVRRDWLVLSLANPRVDRTAMAGLSKLLNKGTETSGSATEQTPEATLATTETAVACPHSVAQVRS